MTERARGIFLSHYQKYWNPKPWQAFVDIKATDGLTTNPKFHEFKQIARDNGVIVGAVHYQRSGIAWKDQLDYFMNVASEADYHYDDFEGYFNVLSKQFSSDAVNFTLVGQYNSKKPFGMYSSKKFLHELMYPHGIYTIRDRPNFWNAQWPFGVYDPRVDEMHIVEKGWLPVLPAGMPMSNCKKWQYSGEKNYLGEREGVGSPHVCLEMFMGTLEDLRIWAKLDVPEPPPETPSSDEYTLGWNAALDEVRGSLDGLTKLEG